jgi:uncharacterized membrane protein
MKETQRNIPDHNGTSDQAVTEDFSKLADIIDEDIEKLVSMHLQAEQEASRHQLLVERITHTLARPSFLYMILVFATLWITANVLGSQFHVLNLDGPPFFWLQGLIGFCALLVATNVLITQNRQQKMADQRRHLDLEIALITDRKVSKLIELVQTLREDMPQVTNHYDPEAEAMKEKTDPDQVLNTLEHSLKEASS